MYPGGQQEGGQSLCSDGTQGLERQGDIGQSLCPHSFSREPVEGWTPVTKAVGGSACDLRGTGRPHRTGHQWPWAFTLDGRARRWRRRLHSDPLLPMGCTTSRGPVMYLLCASGHSHVKQGGRHVWPHPVVTVNRRESVKRHSTRRSVGRL